MFHWKARHYPVSIVRKTASSLKQDASHSIIEQNGLHAVAVTCITELGFCSEHTIVLFPTRLVDRRNPRGYLKVPLSIPALPSYPTEVSFDGIATRFSRPTTGANDHNAFCLSIFPSPEAPVVHVVLKYATSGGVQAAGSNDNKERRKVEHIDSYTIWRVERWTNDFHFHLAVSCVPAVPGPLSDEGLRRRFVESWTNGIRLECPDSELMALTHFAKIKASETIFDTPTLGTVHSPGCMHYCGVWCQDQAEYAAPLFPYLHAPLSKPRAAIEQSFRMIIEYVDLSTRPIPSSVEVDGVFLGVLERGDTAKFAWGLSQYILAVSNSNITAEFFPSVRFACDVLCQHAASSVTGTVHSWTDELESHFPSGDSNLSVNCLALLALETGAEAALLAQDSPSHKKYSTAAARLRQSVHHYFKTDAPWRYDYFHGCPEASRWICLSSLAILPEGVAALRYALTALWREDGDEGSMVGVRTSASAADFKDHSTLYTIIAGMQAGLEDLAMNGLSAFCKARLTRGLSAPYAFECHQNRAQQSGESALVVRVITDGLLGLRPLADKCFALRPVCPPTWHGFCVRSVWVKGDCFDFNIQTTTRGPARMLKLHVQTEQSSAGVTVASASSLIVRIGDGAVSHIYIESR